MATSLSARRCAPFGVTPTRSFYYRAVRDDAGRQFRYAHAVWVTRGCLGCHDEGGSARPYRENQLAGVIAVSLPIEQSGQSSLLNRVVIVAAGALAGILAILVFLRDHDAFHTLADPGAAFGRAARH